MAGSAPSAAQQAIAALAQGEQAFETFTVTLVQNTMDALVSSAISQMKAYADVVSLLERGLTAYRLQANPADGSAIVGWMQTYLPSYLGNAGALATNLPVAWSPDDIATVNGLFQKINLIGGASYHLNGNVTTFPATISFDSTTQPGQTNFYTSPQTGFNAKASPLPSVTDALLQSHGVTILDAVSAVLNNDAEQSFNQLLSLVKAGLYRIVVTDGHILTRATFSMVASDAAQDNSLNIGVSNFQASGNAHYGGKRAGAAVAASYSRINMKVASSSSSSSTTISENVMGEVLVNFKGDYFPAASIQTQP